MQKPLVSDTRSRNKRIIKRTRPGRRLILHSGVIIERAFDDARRERSERKKAHQQIAENLAADNNALTPRLRIMAHYKASCQNAPARRFLGSGIGQ